MTRPIGIDLGTTYTLVATLEKGKPVVVPNAEGQRLTPSVVGFNEAGEPIVGQAARELSPAVFSIKRRMGQEQPTRVGGRAYTPQEISALILGKVKADAEALLGEHIWQAVITVPAYFNERQREATREAGAMAGLEVLRLLNEPTAAALAYGLEREEAHTILVWDLGGGTFDVSILELDDGLFEVKAVSGDRWLGGDDFDERLARHLAQEYGHQTGLDPWEHPHARRRLQRLAEEAKRVLSLSLTTKVAIPPLGPACPRPASVLITRQRMEGLAQDLLERMVGPTRQALADAGLSPQQIDRVILVGGMTRMPAVRDLARRLLGHEPYRLLDPDEAVALGAAIHAGILQGVVQRAVLLDVLPLSLGVETQGGLMATLIPRNTPLPASASRIFTTAADLQTSMEVHLLQGERGLVTDNLSLGRADLQGIFPAPRGVPKVEVTLEADVDGIVHVTAQELLTEQQVSVRMTSAKHLDSQEIARLAEEARRQAAQDAEARSRVEAALQAESLVAAARALLAALADQETSSLPEAPLRAALALVQAALAGGQAETLPDRCAKLRRLLESMPASTADTPLQKVSQEPAPLGLDDVITSDIMAGAEGMSSGRGAAGPGATTPAGSLPGAVRPPLGGLLAHGPPVGERP